MSRDGLGPFGTGKGAEGSVLSRQNPRNWGWVRASGCVSNESQQETPKQTERAKMRSSLAEPKSSSHRVVG